MSNQAVNLVKKHRFLRCEMLEALELVREIRGVA